MNIMNPPPPAPDTLPPIAPLAKAISPKRSICSVLIPEAVCFFAAHDLFNTAAIRSISPRSNASFISNASCFSKCSASSAAPPGAVMRRCCSTMIASDRRETPVKQTTIDVSNSFSIQGATRSGFTITRSAP